MIKQSCFQKMPNYENQKIKAHPTKNTTYGEIPNEWKVSLLKDICVKKNGVQTGPFGSQLHQKDYKKVGTPIITVEHLGENRIIHENLPLVSDEDRDRLNRYILTEGDTVFSRVGSVDRRAFVKNEEEGWLFSGRCLRVRPDPQIADPSYLSWFFGHPNFKDYIRRIAVGATMPSLNTNLLESVEIILPSMDEQKKIASILDSLSEKIDLNQQMNSTLEQLAQTLFKHWFIDFEFPNENGNPYKSSGGRMVDSELGEIPEGWIVGQIKDLVNHLKKSVKPQEEPDKLFHHYSIPAYDSGKVPEREFGSKIMSNKFKVVSNSILVSKLNPETERVWNVGYVDESLSICSTELQVFVSKQESWKSFVYFLFKSDKIREEMICRVTGTSKSHQRISPQDILNIQIILPTKELILEFGNIFNVILKRINCNLSEAENLSQIRDSLLPKLMSGKIRVEC